MIYIDNEQLVTELKKLLLDSKCSQRDIAKKMGISPQAFQNLLNKKQLSFSDMKRVLDCVNCDLVVNFSMRSFPAANQTPAAAPIKITELEPQQQAAAPKVHKSQYRKFTADEAAKIDTARLLTDVRYQVQISSDFGMEVLSMLVEKARQENG
jgi:transcriptional regulator with XRE-family HTH domain